MSDLIHSELYEFARIGARHPATTLVMVFEGIYGSGRSREEWLRFLIHAAPIARRVSFDVAPQGAKVLGVPVPRAREFFGQIESFDPALVQIIDLHTYGGLSARDTAVALKLPGKTVVGNLKIAKAWWQRLLASNSDNASLTSPGFRI